MARQTELGEVARLADRHLDILEEVEGQVAPHRVGDTWEEEAVLTFLGGDFYGFPGFLCFLGSS